MRFLVDECTGPAVAAWLRDQHHQVFSVFDQARGVGDDDIIRKALEENWILVTNDKEFGEKVYRDGRLHRGVILLRLEDERPSSKIRVLSLHFSPIIYCAGGYGLVCGVMLGRPPRSTWLVRLRVPRSQALQAKPSAPPRHDARREMQASHLIEAYPNRLPDSFVVVTEEQVRFARE